MRAIWAVNDGEKIERDDLNNPNKTANSAWDNHKIKIFGARNEIVAFQLIVETGKDGVTALSVALPELHQTSGPATIKYLSPQLDPTLYLKRPIQIFSVNYMNVEQPSRAEWVYRQGSPAAPKDPTGWKPVQLVPENARQGRGGFPLNVPANSNQAVWIEIYTSRNLPAGVYHGTVVVSADKQKHTIPIELELFDFTLPDQNSMQAMVYYESLQPKLYQGRDLDAEYHRFAHRQRIELVQAYDKAAVEAARARFAGTDFSNDRGYEGPGKMSGTRSSRAPSMVQARFLMSVPVPGVKRMIGSLSFVRSFPPRSRFCIFRTSLVHESTTTSVNSPITFIPTRDRVKHFRLL